MHTHQSTAKTATVALAAALAVMGGGCTDDGEQGGECSIPTSWSAPDWDTNTVEALGLRDQLDTLTGSATMRGAEEGSAVVDDLGDLTAVYESGAPSLAAVVSPGYAPIVDDAFGEFVAVVAAGPQDLIDDSGNWAPGADGGLFGSDMRGIDEGGLEVRQLVDKGLFSGAGMYRYALGLTEGEIDETTIDAIAAAWGANPMLDPAGELTDAADYAYEMGFFAQMGESLVAAKAHAADPACAAERDEALRTFFSAWEQSMLARLVYYANQTALILASASTDDEYADGLHELAEGIGLAAGFYGLPDPGDGPLTGRARTITDADLDAIMTAFGVDLGDLGASTTGSFVDSVPDYEAAVQTAEGVVMSVYGVDASTIAIYRNPAPG